MSQSDTAARFFRSAGAATFSQLWRVGVTFLTHLVLRRYVPREDWGLYDWAEVVFLVLGAVRDLGLPPQTLRTKPKPFGNLLALEGFWGGGLAVLVALGAPILVMGLKDPHSQAIPVLQAMTLFLFLEGLALVPLTWLEGELAVGKAVGPEIVRNLCYAVTAVGLALSGKGVWSMVIAQITASAVFASILWLRARGRIPLAWLRGRMLELLRGSTRLALIWLLILLVRYIDRLILGALFDARTLATYSFAYFAAFIVPYVMLQPVGRAAYPAFVAFAAEPERQFGAYRLSTLFLLALEVPAALFLFFNAELVLRILGGTQWVGAPDYLRILCFAPLVDPFSRFGGELLATRHRDRIWILATATTLASFLGFGIFLTLRMGALGMAWANYLPFGALFMTWAMARQGGREFRRLVGEIAWLYVVPVPIFVGVALVAEPGGWWRFGASLAAAGVTAGLYWWRYGSQFVGFFRGREV